MVQDDSQMIKLNMLLITNYINAKVIITKQNALTVALVMEMRLL